MNRVRAWCVLLACPAMAASGALHAQARAPVPKAPRIEPRIDKRSETSPCVWLGAAGRVCYANVRSRAIALAWEKGLDEHSVPLDAGARARKSAEMENWLRRLVGTYRIEGTYKNRGGTSLVRGTAKCSGIGGGPGVSCEITAAWKAPKESYKERSFDEALYDAMRPLVFRFGIDPDASQIRATLMDYRALKIRGFLIEDVVAFSGESNGEHDHNNPLVHYAWDSSLVAIKPGGDVDMKFTIVPTSSESAFAGLRKSRGQIFPNLHTEFDMQLHREIPVDADTPRESP